MNRNLDSFYNKHAKRWCDAVAGASLLPATSPVLVACAVAIKLDDGGPVFFHQRRVGKGGQPFTVHKLRTMTVGTDQGAALRKRIWASPVNPGRTSRRWNCRSV